MSVIPTYYENSELSFAAYSSLYSGMSKNDYIEALKDINKGMSQSQAEQFVDNWAVIDQQPNTQNGFSATVFERLDESGIGTGEFTLAIRGTEASLIDWDDTSLDDIGGNGIAIKQAIDLFNYYQRLTATSSNVIQYEYHEEVITTQPYTVIPAYITSTSVPVSPFRTSGIGALAGKQLSVAGHSLGGHLAMIMARLDPANVMSVHTYNSPGFDTGAVPLRDNTEWFFNELSREQLEAQGNTTIGTLFPSGIITNLAVPEDVISDIGTTFGEPLNHYAEVSGSGLEFIENAHSIQNETDALAVCSLLAILDPDLTLSDITPILEAASNQSEVSLEEIVNAVGDLFGVGSKVGIDKRDELRCINGFKRFKTTPCTSKLLVLWMLSIQQPLPMLPIRTQMKAYPTATP